MGQAQYNLAICYEGGFGVAESRSEAIRWYRKASANGFTQADDALRRLGQ